MMPMNVQRLKILDRLEIQSSASRVICYCLEIVESNMLYPIALTLHGDELWSRDGFHLCPVPQCKT